MMASIIDMIISRYESRQFIAPLLDWRLLKDAEWGWGCFIEDYLFLIGLIADIKPRNILEIGTQSGLGAVIAACATLAWTLEYP
jgi:predicted O-methyltransferase YrrM